MVRCTWSTGHCSRYSKSQERNRHMAGSFPLLTQSEQLNCVIAQQLFFGRFLQSHLCPLIETLFPWQAIGAPEAAVLPHAAVNVVHDLGLHIFWHPRIDAEVNVVPLVTDRYQLLDPRPAGVGANNLKLRKIAGDAIQVDWTRMLAGHCLKDMAHLH